MRVIVVGGGKVGGYLAQELRAGGHAVIVIEQSHERAMKVAEETGALSMEGNGTDLTLLHDLELRPRDFFLAVTGVDEDNLVACQLARTAFKVTKVLARLNNPRNRATFDALGIPVVSVTDLLAQVISRELDVSELVRVAVLGRGEVSLFEVELPERYEARLVQDVSLPRDSVFVAVRRDGEVIVPHGETELLAGDRVLVLSKVELEDQVTETLMIAGTTDGE